MKLKDIATIKHGFAFKGDYFTNVPTRNILLTPTNFTLKGGFQYADRYYSNDGEIPEEFVLHKDDLIVTMTDLSKEIDTIGYGALIPDDSDHVFLHNQRIGLVTLTNPTVDKFYLYWLMRTKSYQRTIAGSSNGATVHHTSPGRILNYSWDFPPLTTQKKIASILSAYDSQIENNQKRIKLLEQMAENLYKEWFVRFRFPGYENAEFEGGVPKGWEYKPLGEIASFERGLSYSSEEIDCEDGLNLVNLKNIEAFGGYRRDGLKHYNGKYKTAQVVKKGDLVMGVTDMTQDRRTVGAVALIPEIQGTSVISADLVKIVSKQPNLFLYCLCRFGNYSKFFSQFANGANVLHLKPNTLLNKKVLMPTDHLIKMLRIKRFRMMNSHI